MPLTEFTLDGHVAVLTLNGGENRFNPTFLDAFLEALDDLENETEATTLVVRSGHEKIFCNGIDLEWLAPSLQQGDLATARAFLHHLNRLYRRVATYPMVTVAALNGHVFAGGAMLACAFDFRYMRSDRGFFCLPEVDLGIPFLPGMNALLRKAIPPHKLDEMQYTGLRLTAEECAAAHIVRGAFPGEALMDEVMAFARSVDKRRPVVAELKRRLNRDVLHAIDVEDGPYIESGPFFIP